MSQVLVIGNGGREQALAWKLSQSHSVDKVYVAPGNGGSRGLIENVEIAFDDAKSLLKFAKSKKLALTVIGQEAASEAGVVDVFRAAGLTIFGPTKLAVRIESSKIFAKDLMTREQIPTATFKNFADAEAARVYAKSRARPVVIKADGLATGKGVFIPDKDTEIDTAIDELMVKKTFGVAGSEVVVEDFLRGREASIHVITDGQESAIFPPSQDHKQVYDNDEGPNTGGMGVVAPVDWINKRLLDKIEQKVVKPALSGLFKQNAKFNGCLYPGLIIDGNDLKVLEFNARFGDPECEAYMRLIDCDLFEVLKACAKGQLVPDSIKWHSGYAVSVVLASQGYPGNYSKGLLITGVDVAEKQPDVVVFHAGTAMKNGQLITAGGRVLNITATGKTLDAALDKAYDAVKSIHFEGMHYRTDIGHRNVSKETWPLRIDAEPLT
ncbi:MAG TPA: phosphoribosylamine--glycine ligase [Candidatus Saccharimonadales bacterium]|nr:phosphoribosylamine--glycine ligase [Candidatus Saccharimonadales bacterium]